MDALQAIYERRSCRCFLPQQVDERQLTTVLAAGTYAPTGMGRQSPKIIVLQKREDIDLLARMNAAIMGQPAAQALLQKWGVAGNYIGVGHCLLGYPAAAPNPRVSRKPDYIVRP